MSMKKTLYILMAASVLAIACVKEANNEEAVLPFENGEAQLDPTAIPETINGIILDTKTAYSAAGEFTWVNTDQIRLLVTQDLTTYSAQGIYTYYIKTLSENQKSAVFTSTGSAGDLTQFVDGTWKSTGFAVYPTKVLDRYNTPEAHSYGAPWFTLAREGNVSGKVAGTANDIILIGVMDESIGNYKFYTATAVVKVTVKNIPANAAAFKICTSDKSNYPVDGDFSLSKNAAGEPVMTFIPDWVSDFKGFQKVDLSAEGAIESRDFYFNVPPATYPANTLSFVIEDANGGQIFKRTLSQEVTLSRNDLLPLSGDYSLAYSHRISVAGAATAPTMSYAFDSRVLRVNISTSDVNDPTEYKDGNRFSNNWSTGPVSGSFDLTLLSNKSSVKFLQESGKYYLHYMFCSTQTLPGTLADNNVVAYGSIPFTFISSTDASSYAKQYSFTKTDGDNFWHPGTGSNYTTTMTLAASDNASLGNLKMTELFGKTAAHPLYGTLEGGNLVFTCNGEGEGEDFFTQGNRFHVAQSPDDNVQNATENISFTVADGPVLTNTAYLVMKYTPSYPANWNFFIYGKQLVFN